MDFSFIKIDKVTVSSAVGIFVALFVLALVFHSMALGFSSILFAVFAVCVPLQSEHSGSLPVGWIALVALLACLLFFLIGLNDVMDALRPTL